MSSTILKPVELLTTKGFLSQTGKPQQLLCQEHPTDEAYIAPA